MDDESEILREARRWIRDGIRSSSRGKYAIKIKTLMSSFGYRAEQRVRQSSFEEVLDLLDEWGIAYTYADNSANSYITLSRARPPAKHDGEPKPPPTPLASYSPVSILDLLYHFGESPDESYSRATSLGVRTAIWSYQPVCLLIEAQDEFFSFACGYLAAMMRRRSQMIRSALGYDEPSSPEILSVDQLKPVLGYASNVQNEREFPRAGSVYVVRDNTDNVEIDELVALTREYYLPHTYRMRAKFGSTSGDRQLGQRVCESLHLEPILTWMSAFAGSFELHMPGPQKPIDLASLFAESARTGDSLLQTRALGTLDQAFKAGHESTEHMCLKGVLLNHLRNQFPASSIAVEKYTRDEPPGEWLGPPPEPSTPTRPDLKVEEQLWIEVETLRSLAHRGSSPFLTLEAKLRSKLERMRVCQQVWLIVPSDVAVLATEQMQALANNLQAALGRTTLRWGFVDMLAEKPLFVTAEPLPLQTVSRISGVTWRTRKQPPPTPLTWNDIAGYSELKSRLQHDLLDPLLEPEKYARHGLLAASGLLLYGLPGCGKSLIGRVLASESNLTCRLMVPSDMTSMWLGEGVIKIRALFDWAFRQAPCLLILDELDAVAPQRREADMHTDEKRQVNELLAQLDRIADKNVIVVATTNYVRGIDTALQRCGRFDMKLPVFPPNSDDRASILDYYLTPPRLKEIEGVGDIDRVRLASETPLFAPVDLKAAVQAAARRAVFNSGVSGPTLTTELVLQAIREHPRSIRREMAADWLQEAEAELGSHDERIRWLREEMVLAFGGRSTSG